MYGLYLGSDLTIFEGDNLHIPRGIDSETIDLISSQTLDCLHQKIAEQVSKRIYKYSRLR